MTWFHPSAARLHGPHGIEFRVLLMIALLAGLLSSTARAVEVAWLQPERSTATPGAALAVELTTAPEFGGPVAPMSPAALSMIGGTLARESVVMTAPIQSGAVLRCIATLPKPGVAVFTATLKPRRLTLPRVDVERYLRQVHATDDISTEWETFSAADSWRELRGEFLKTYVRVGEPGSQDNSWAAASLPVDIVPLSDPTSLTDGGEFVFRVLRDREALPDVVVSAIARGGDREHVVVTDRDGCGRVRLDSRGAWLITMSVLRRVRIDDHDWENRTVSLVLDVR